MLYIVRHIFNPYVIYNITKTYMRRNLIYFEEIICETNIIDIYNQVSIISVSYSRVDTWIFRIPSNETVKTPKIELIPLK